MEFYAPCLWLGKMGKVARKKFDWFIIFLMLPLLGLATGCQSMISAINACNEGNSLLDSTRLLRDTVSEIPPVPRELDKALTTSLTAEPGDVLLIQPADLDSPIRLPGDQPVLPDGNVSLGKYGRLNVAGRNLDEIEEMVRGQISSVTKEAGPITVRLINRQSKVYYVIGEVNAPGIYPLNGRETVLDAILQAGGLNEKASRQNIVLSRPTPPESCRIVLPVCFKEITQLGDTTTNYQLKPGDRVFVPSRDFWKDKNSKTAAPICCKNHQACDLHGKPPVENAAPAGKPAN
ncbi:MAG: hypothetical protein RL595_2719 [Planctomycetota bacterium]